MLRVRQVSLVVKRRTLYHDVSFEVPPSTRFEIMGANGSGKTVLLKTVLQLATPTAGTIVNTYSSVGYLLERPAFYPSFSVGHNLELSALYAPTQVAWAPVADDFQLRALLGRKARTLSLGQKQRLGLAKAFLGYPDLVVLDEPFSNLDHDYKEQLAEYLRHYSAQPGKAILYTSHERVPMFEATDTLRLYAAE